MEEREYPTNSIAIENYSSVEYCKPIYLKSSQADSFQAAAAADMGVVESMWLSDERKEMAVAACRGRIKTDDCNVAYTVKLP